MVEASKPRRGPDREHMVTVLEDVPASLAGVLSAEDGERDVQQLTDRLSMLDAHADDPLAPAPLRDRAAAQAAAVRVVIDRHARTGPRRAAEPEG